MSFEVFDTDLGMWVMNDETEDDQSRLEREYEQEAIRQRAVEVAREVHEEVEAMEWEQEQMRSPRARMTTAHVAHGSKLLAQVGKYVRIRPSSRFVWHEPGSEMLAAPWGVLLDTALPLGTLWSPVDMLRLRGVCSSLRDERSTGQFFACVLNTLGVRLRWHCHNPSKIFELATRVWSELSFVHSLRSVAAHAAGLSQDDPQAEHICCVAGSHALSRAILLGSDVAGGDGSPCPVSWRPGDIDIFVGSVESKKRSYAAFKALVSHSEQACHSLFRHSSDPTPSVFWPAGLTGPRIRPRTQLLSRYNEPGEVGIGHLPSSIESAMATQGVAYERDAVLDYAGSFSDDLIRAVRALPPTLGIKRPYRIERVAEVFPFGSAHSSGSANYSFGALWPMPMKINIVQYASARPSSPFTTAHLLEGFDVIPAQVTMRVDRQLRPTFEASAEARTRISRRELALTQYAFGPAHSLRRDHIEEAITKQVDRIDKYMRTYGFRLVVR